MAVMQIPKRLRCLFRPHDWKLDFVVEATCRRCEKPKRKLSMQRYLLFHGKINQHQHGWMSFRASTATIPEARDIAKAAGQWAEWWHVIDSKTGLLVASSDYFVPRPL